MRNCPHCSRDIRDEAIYCRYCHRDVEPALWLTTMRKCPYCAEWIQHDAEQCTYCEKVLFAGTPGRSAPFVDSSLSDFVSDLRQDAEDEQAEPPGVEPESKPSAKAEPSLLRDLERRSRSPLRPSTPPALAPAPDEDPTSFGARPLRELGYKREMAALPSEEAPEILSDKPQRGLPRLLLRLLLLVILLGGTGGGGYYLLTGPASGLLAQALATDAPPTTTSLPPPSPTLRQAPTLPPPTAATVAPTGEATVPAASDCLKWDQITREDEGREVCAYGWVKRWFAVEDIPFVAIFSETAGTFAIVDRTQAHPQVGPGTCIQGRGVVEIMRGTRPNIDVQGELESCENG